MTDAERIAVLEARLDYAEKLLARDRQLVVMMSLDLEFVEGSGMPLLEIIKDQMRAKMADALKEELKTVPIHQRPGDGRRAQYELAVTVRLPNSPAGIQ